MTKAGFWVAPEGSDSAMTIMPIGGGDDGLGAELHDWRSGSNGLARAEMEAVIARCHRVGALLPQLAQTLARQTSTDKGVLFDVTDYTEEERDLLTQALGEGEVSGVVALPDGVTAQIAEATMAGLWRVRFTDAQDRLIADYLEIGSAPEAAVRAAIVNAQDVAFGEAPQGAMNVMPLLAEIKARVAAYKTGDPAHIVNFSLFPMTPEDMAFLQASLGDGPVRLVSRGYGKCVVHATATRHVWSVQFFNAMDEIVLDTLEIGGMPVAALAATEDFHDSAERLIEIHEAYFK
jgi:hydrogenase-1 operon protein HyaF